MTSPSDVSGGLHSIRGFARRLRNGETSAEESTLAYLERVAALEPRLGAFSYVAKEDALAAARGFDRLLGAGVDLGPLMGVPVAVKDLFTVERMPTTAGSDLDLADLIEPEGSFVKALKRAGCVILGKTRTTEFAAGTFNLIHRTSWNPWDATMQRMPGGSSSGSAVALAAKLCAFSIGSDTGGSVRQPAALCGVFGYKATSGMWPMNGIFPLSPTLDRIGIFTTGAEDGALVFSTLADRPVPVARPLRGLRLGKPVKHFFDDLEAEISAGIDRALAMLRRAGVEFVPIDFPEAAEIKDTFGRMVPAELLAFLGRERFLSSRDRIDPVVRARLDDALDVTATNYIQLVRRHVALRGLVKRKMNGLDALITPTTPVLPMPVAECTTVEAAIAWNRRSLRNTQPVNLFGLCGISIPIQASDAALPVGLQIVCEAGADEKLFSIALAVEEIARSA